MSLFYGDRHKNISGLQDKAAYGLRETLYLVLSKKIQTIH